MLDGETFDALALGVLVRADRVLAVCDDDRSRTRRAWVLEGIERCHELAGDPEAALDAVAELLNGSWPSEAMAARLGAAASLAGMPSLQPELAIEIVERAIATGDGSQDEECRALVASLLQWLADAVAPTSWERRHVLLTRVIDEFGDVDSAVDSARDRLADPLYEGLALAEQPGRSGAAEAAFRRALDDGQEVAWLELASLLSTQAGRQDEEEQALRAAIEAETLERSTYAAFLLGCLLRYERGDRTGAREAFGRATLATGPHALASLKELAMLAVLDGDHQARRALVAELAGRALTEWDPAARDKRYAKIAATSRLGYARPLIALRARRWHRQRKKAQRRAAG